MIILLVCGPNRLLGKPGHALVAAARAQIGATVHYDSSYQRIAYPNGDVPMDRGVCTDVVIRALRTAFDLDLQQHVHEDMKAHFRIYPHLWGLSRPDKNIDHRRVPNLQKYFSRYGQFGQKVQRRTFPHHCFLLPGW